ncbi:aminoglycoside phosphotransferase family protein [Streptomyces sp. NPDC006798]|uniref:aminoglycoside phosphotransferase family protein n=1 Tax=Streptomyces sp. NPDC006798 TaxID=3155462 RepID=UPI0033F4A4E9
MGDPLPYRALSARLPAGGGTGPFAVHEGQFHRVVVGTDRVICFARTGAAEARLPARAAVLRALSGAGLAFRVPAPLGEPVARDGDVPPYLVLTRVPGAPLAAGALRSPAAFEAVARQYAELLSGLRDAGAESRTRAVLPPVRAEEWREFAAGARESLFPLMSAAGRARAERELTAAEALPPLDGAVVHGDLGAENVLWETESGLPRLSGVVDWDEVALGDPAVDLAAVGASHGDGLLARVRELGGWTDGATTDRITAIRGTFALQQALYGLRDGDDAEVADGLDGYR